MSRVKVNISGLWQSIWWGDARAEPSDLSTYRRLANRLHYDLPRGRSGRSVVTATPLPSPSAASAATALACCLAEELLQPVLLVDAAARSPEVTRAMGAEGQPGLVDLLSDPHQSVSSFIRSTTREHLSFLPVGQTGRHSAAGAPEALASLLAKTAPLFDFVVFSTGSILDNPLSLALSPLTGSVLLLAVEGETRAEDLDTASQSLSSSGAADVRLVLATPVRVSN